MNNKFLELFKSRKFWALVIGAVLMVIKAVAPDFPLSEDQLTEVVYQLVAYIVGVGLERK